MKLMKPALAIAVSAALLAGCEGDSGDNAGNEPIIHTPGRMDVTIQASAPAGFYPVQTLDVGLASSVVTSFVAFGYDFTDPEDLLKFFLLPTGGSFDFNIEKGNLMMVEAFNPVSKSFMAGLVGYHDPDAPADLGSIAIDPITEAVADQVLVMDVDPSEGLSDEYRNVVLEDLFTEAGQGQLVLEGYTPTDAQNATDGDIQGALDRLLADGSSADTNLNAFITEYLGGSVWKASGSDMSLSFADGGVTYNDGSGNLSEGTYDLIRNAGATTLEITLPVIGTESVGFDDVISGTNTLTFLSNPLMKQ